MRAIKIPTTKTIYYKTVERDWLQPVYGAGVTFGGTLLNNDLISVQSSSIYSGLYNPYQLFNNQFASGGHDTGFRKIWESGAGGGNINPWIKFSTPYPIKITSIAFDFRVEFAYRVPRAVTIYGLDEKGNPTLISDKSGFNQIRDIQHKAIQRPNYYKGYWLYFDGSGGTSPYHVTEVANLFLTAKEKFKVIGTSEDHDSVVHINVNDYYGFRDGEYVKVYGD